MENNVYESVYLNIYHNKEEGLLRTVWTAKTSDMNVDDFKSEMFNWVEVINKHKATKNIADTSDFLFSIVPTLQDWYNETITPKCFEAGLKKIAFIVPSDIFSQISIEQIFDDQKEVVINYFSNIKDGKDWLLNDKLDDI